MILKINYKKANSRTLETRYGYILRPSCFIDQRRADVPLGAKSIDTVQRAISYAHMPNVTNFVFRAQEKWLLNLRQQKELLQMVGMARLPLCLLFKFPRTYQAMPQFRRLVAGFPCSSPGKVMWDLWWTKWHWGRFSQSTSVSLVNSHSTDCSTLIIYHPGLVQ
jgi:hypothetical protein